MVSDHVGVGAPIVVVQGGPDPVSIAAPPRKIKAGSVSVHYHQIQNRADSCWELGTGTVRRDTVFSRAKDCEKIHKFNLPDLTTMLRLISLSQNPAKLTQSPCRKPRILA